MEVARRIPNAAVLVADDAFCITPPCGFNDPVRAGAPMFLDPPIEGLAAGAEARGAVGFVEATGEASTASTFKSSFPGFILLAESSLGAVLTAALPALLGLVFGVVLTVLRLVVTGDRPIPAGDFELTCQFIIYQCSINI